jgi:hypothetical protein
MGECFAVTPDPFEVRTQQCMQVGQVIGITDIGKH